MNSLQASETTHVMKRPNGIRSSRKYMELIKITVSNNFVYFWSFLVKNLFFVLIMLVYLLLWKNIYATKGAQIAGFGINSMIWYLVVTEIITLSRPNGHVQINKDVKDGSIAYLLNKPYHYVLYNISLFIGDFSVKFVANCLTGVAVGIVFVGFLSGFNIGHLPFILMSILVGCLINFLIYMNIALTAFWLEENSAFFWIYSKLVFTLGGMLMPIDLFPVWLQAITRYLPFAYVTYVPGKLAVDFSFDLFFREFPIQVGYMLFFLLTAFMMYGKGAKNLNVNGG